MPEEEVQPLPSVRKVKYLRKRGTHLIFQRTKILAKKPDMLPCSAEDAARHIHMQKKIRLQQVAEAQAAQEADDLGEDETQEQFDVSLEDDTPSVDKNIVEEVAEERSSEDAPELSKDEVQDVLTGEVIDAMDRDALELAATSLKVRVVPAMKDSTLRGKIKEAVGWVDDD